MPPKKGKGKKKGKKELERERLAEEERLRAEEEARVAQQQRRELELRESHQREALEALFRQGIKDQERLATEIAALSKLVEARKLQLATTADDRRKEADVGEFSLRVWKTFLECRKLPNPQNETEINTYLDLWAVETLESDGEFSLNPLLAELPAAELLCAQVQHEVYSGSPTAKEISRLTKHLLRLRELIHEKWDLTTAQVLQHVDQFGREPNENFQMATSTQDYTFCIWGNLTKNPRCELYLRRMSEWRLTSFQIKRYKSVEFGERHMSSGLPKPLVLSNVAIRMILESSHSATVPYEQQTGPRILSVTGPILLFDLIEMPDLPKTVDQWTIRPVSKGGKLKRLNYPFKKDLKEVLEEEGEEEAADASVWPMQVTFSIDPGCFTYADVTTVRWWNSENNTWDDDGITDVEIDSGSCCTYDGPLASADYRKSGRSRQIPHRSLCANSGGTVLRSLIYGFYEQDAYAEFPLQDWDMHPSGLNKAIIHIYGALSDVEIEIGEGQCRLVSPRTEYTETHFSDRWMSPPMLFMLLARMGLKFIGPTSIKNIDIPDLILKNPAAEEACLTGLTICANQIACRRSPSNKQLSSSKCAFQVRYCHPDEPWPVPEDVNDPRAGWSTAVYDANWKMGDTYIQGGFIVSPGVEVTDSTTFIVNSDANQGTIHTSPQHLIEDLIPEAEKSLVSSPIFAQTIAQVVGITRLLSFS
ncbi:hypothetical protein DFS34DRAFT_598231 [Phlyctochytrium arcticum]|nr:hypothetical protein DFS34DRAFT_598231 [Phlyctochytrium arcticum]